MPQKAWSAKRERQYEHIKEGLEDRGTSEDKAQAETKIGEVREALLSGTTTLVDHHASPSAIAEEEHAVE